MATIAAAGVRKSTIVRFFNPAWPVRIAFPVLDAVAPALGARWAERIWFTLPERPLPTAVTGAPVSVGLNRRRVRAQMWGDGPVVYCLHGWAGSGVQFEPFVAPLVAAGYQVIALDAPSHGRSDAGVHGPHSSTIPEFMAALGAMVDEFGPAHAVIGHSLGATALATALCDGLPASRAVMLAPMASPRRYAERFGAALGLGPRTFRRLIARVEQRVGAPMHHFDVPEFGRAIAMPPTLVIHDRDDAMTPVSDSIAIANAWPTARLVLTSGLGHRRLLRDDDVVKQVVDFVATPAERPNIAGPATTAARQFVAS
jgi:pimeloyl-ACP methyl ester carboxylesterase